MSTSTPTPPAAPERFQTREELDRVAPRHPVLFNTGPDSMLNSLALQLAGIDRNFKVPAGSSGIVMFDEKGEPTGLMHAFSPRINAKIIRSGDDYHALEEVGTVNGTFVNDVRIPTGVPVTIHNGDLIKIGLISMKAVFD